MARHLDTCSFFQLMVTLRAPLARMARQGLENMKKKRSWKLANHYTSPSGTSPWYSFVFSTTGSSESFTSPSGASPWCMFVFQLLFTYRAPLARVARHLDACSFFQLLVTLRAPLAQVARQGLRDMKKSSWKLANHYTCQSGASPWYMFVFSTFGYLELY